MNNTDTQKTETTTRGFLSEDALERLENAKKNAETLIDIIEDALSQTSSLSMGCKNNYFGYQKFLRACACLATLNTGENAKEAAKISYSPTPQEKIYAAVFGCSYEDAIALMPNDAEEAIEIALKTLTPRAEKIIRLRYGFSGEGVCKTLAEVAEMEGVTSERIRQIEEKGIRQLRNPHRQQILKAGPSIEEEACNALQQEREAILADLENKKRQMDTFYRESADIIASISSEISTLTYGKGENWMSRVTVKEFLENTASIKKIPVSEPCRYVSLRTEPIENLDLSRRAIHYLKYANINTIDDLRQKSETDLLNIRNFGDTCLKEVRQKLRFKYGIELEIH